MKVMGNAQVVLTLNNAVMGGFGVTAATANGTATSDVDFDSASVILNFTGTAGETQTLTVPITDDSIVEGGENFTVSLSGLTGATNIDITDTGTVTITDNDAAVLTVEDVTVNENGTAAVGVRLNNTVSGGFRVTASTTGGTATEGTDYTATTTELTFTGSENERQTAYGADNQ